MSDPKEQIELEINGQKMPADTYEVIEFTNGNKKVVAVYHDQEGYTEDKE